MECDSISRYALKPPEASLFDAEVLEKPAFTVLGRKAWMPLQKPEDFAALLKEARESGLIEKLMGLNGGKGGAMTNSDFLGVAVMHEDGNMDYYIAVEVRADAVEAHDDALERFAIPASRWAILRGKGSGMDDISKLEQYGYCEWLPKSGLELANTPQMNVFLSDGEGGYTELWLPVAGAESITSRYVTP